MLVHYFLFGINDQNELCFPKRKVVGIFRQLPLKPTNIVWGFASHAFLLQALTIMKNQALPQSNLNFHYSTFSHEPLMSLCSTSENVTLR